MKDEDFMRLAIENAKKASFPFGGVVVKDNEVIGNAIVGPLMFT